MTDRAKSQISDKREVTNDVVQRVLERKKYKVPGHVTIYIDKDGNAPAWDEYIKYSISPLK